MRSSLFRRFTLLSLVVFLLVAVILFEISLMYAYRFTTPLLTPRTDQVGTGLAIAVVLSFSPLPLIVLFAGVCYYAGRGSLEHVKSFLAKATRPTLTITLFILILWLVLQTL